MPAPRPIAATAVLLLWGALGVSGCATTVPVQHWQPAGIDVAGMQRIAIVDFRGEHGAEISAALNARLWDNQFYRIVDQSEVVPVQHAAYVPETADDQVLARARERGIDGVVLGEVRAYRCEDEILRSSEFHLHDATDSAARGPEARGELHVGFSQQEQIRREATVTIALRLVDARTGEVRASREATHHFRGESTPGGPALPPRGEVLDQLMQMCLDEFIALLAPHEKECRVKLATSRWYSGEAGDVRAGNRLADDGDWDGARQRWQAALQRDPDADAALYNLAIDAARRRAYAEAEEYAMRAIRVRHTDGYARGLEQIRQQRTAHESVEQQRTQQVLQASALLLP